MLLLLLNSERFQRLVAMVTVSACLLTSSDAELQCDVIIAA